ncbi:ABC transporter substrate-binding protein [Flaviflexus equikiangi]|uniref:ABC transporter substrate-binding protein n=1 Tax=Flaviflexus equikiangi TaxID=2758573 RepID=A0ABS2TDN5_9ACTO|nr:ABC transporter substrate-binding protein [Flaviflexus equikiangi]MBM9432193.1 ABC transporter substrate-binding protein [Flaviflexus equikiangi]
MKRTLALLTILGLGMGACSSDDPLADDAGGDQGESRAIVIGSQDYYSNEIIAEIYAQALEAEGFEVEREFRIGQREAYVPDIESGAIDLFPEYSGPLLRYWAGETDVQEASEVHRELVEIAPEGVRVLEYSPATDQDAYFVTREFAEEWDLESLGDLANVTVPMTIGGNSELETRPNGPQGLLDVYGIEVGFTPIEDGGGQLTVNALEAGDIQMALIYTADPKIADLDVVMLEDTESMFLASHVVPLASDNVDEQAEEIINRISAAMDTDQLVALNARSVNDQLPAATIAADWLADQNF